MARQKLGGISIKRTVNNDALVFLPIAVKPTEKDLISTGFHALSDPIRLQVLTLLENQEQCVCDLCEQLTISQSKLSFHLKRLRDAELVHTRQEGRWIYYRLNPDQFYRLRHYLDSYGQAIQDYGTRHCCE